MITVPDFVTKKVEVSVITFARQDVAQTDSWINTFTALYKGNSLVAYSQTAVTGDLPVIGWVILNGLKGNIVREKWDRFLIYTGDKEKLAKDFKADDLSLFYVYVIGKDGRIKWSIKSSKATNSDIASMLDAVKKELSTP